MTDTSIKDAVREKYGQAALRVGGGCCGASVGTEEQVARSGPIICARVYC